jgi:hypothetical protein
LEGQQQDQRGDHHIGYQAHAVNHLLFACTLRHRQTKAEGSRGQRGEQISNRQLTEDNRQQKANIRLQAADRKASDDETGDPAHAVEGVGWGGVG